MITIENIINFSREENVFTYFKISENHLKLWRIEFKIGEMRGEIGLCKNGHIGVWDSGTADHRNYYRLRRMFKPNDFDGFKLFFKPENKKGFVVDFLVDKILRRYSK